MAHNTGPFMYAKNRRRLRSECTTCIRRCHTCKSIMLRSDISTVAEWNDTSGNSIMANKSDGSVVSVDMYCMHLRLFYLNQYLESFDNDRLSDSRVDWSFPRFLSFSKGKPKDAFECRLHCGYQTLRDFAATQSSMQWSKTICGSCIL